MSEFILQLEDISKRFSSVEVLHNVDFSLNYGEIHALLGENGAGKSTLVKLITGFHKPEEGEIFLDGNLVSFSDTRDSREAGIAAIYQELSLFPDLDVAENIFIGRQPLTKSGLVDWGKLYAKSQELLDSLGVNIDLKQKARNLSIAEQQMVEIARALSINARILIMDEPTSSLTLNEVEDLFRLVRNIREAGTSVIFISHRLEELFDIADRVTVLRDGYYVGTKAITETSREDLIRMMVGRPISDQYPKMVASKADVILSVENLAREGSFRDVNFELRRGEILGFAGLVGAGRTDLANAIFGINPASSGVIKLNGNPLSITSPQQAMKLGLAYVPEDRLQHGLVTEMNITNNITLPRLDEFSKFGWVLNTRERKAAYQIANQMKVKANSIYQLTRELSGGNQQKVVLGKWLSTNPQVLILDEPTRGIDVGTKNSVHQLMSELAAEGMAIILISSELPEIIGMSDRILVMREGYVTGEFSREQATQEKILTAATEDVRARTK